MRKPEFIARQGRRPSGLLGYIVAWVMAKETAGENIRTLDILDIGAGDAVLEIGCGHGATLQAAAHRHDQARFTGIDFSEVMLRVARRRNRRLLTSGRLQLIQGDIADITLSDETFDNAFSVHTVYFWAKPQVHLRQILRFLKPGGRFVLGFRASEDATFAVQFPASVYHIRSAGDVEALFQQCGFCDIRCQSEIVGGRTINWITAHKPGD